MAEERIQKILAKAGIASRRKAEELITEGVVTVNGKVVKLGDKATLGKDAIKVRGKLLQGAEAPVYLAFYKPKGVISMLIDNENRPTLSDYLQKVQSRVFPVGRLDFMSEGLILLTNDGDFAEKLQRRDDIPRVYRVKVKGHLTSEMIQRLEKGAKIGNRVVKPHSVRVAKELDAKSQVDIVMLGSGAIDVKAMCELKGFLVDKITRTAIGHLTLRGLVPGHYRLLKASQAQALLDQPELGMKLLEHEAESDKPKGQRKHHAKKVVAEDTDTEAASKADERPKRKVTPRTTRAPSDRPQRSDRPARPSAGKSFGSDRPTRPAFGKSFGGDRPARSGFGKSFGGDRPQRSDRPSRDGAGSFAIKPRGEGSGSVRRPGAASRYSGKESYGADRPSFSRSERSERSEWSDRPQRGAGKSFGSDRPRTGGKSFGGDRPQRSDRPSWGDRDDRPARPSYGKSFGDDRPRTGGGKSFGGDRPQRSGFGKSFGGDRPARSGAGKSFGGDRPQRSDRPSRPGGSKVVIRPKRER